MCPFWGISQAIQNRKINRCLYQYINTIQHPIQLFSHGCISATVVSTSVQTADFDAADDHSTSVSACVLL